VVATLQGAGGGALGVANSPAGAISSHGLLHVQWQSYKQAPLGRLLEEVTATAHTPKRSCQPLAGPHSDVAPSMQLCVRLSIRNSGQHRHIPTYLRLVCRAPGLACGPPYRHQGPLCSCVFGANDRAAVIEGAAMAQYFVPTKFIWRFGGNQVRTEQVAGQEESHAQSPAAMDCARIVNGFRRATWGCRRGPDTVVLRAFPRTGRCTCAAHSPDGSRQSP
jgi:hypothetical protein